MSDNLVLVFYGVGIVLFGILIGYFINKNDINHNPRTKDELLNNFLNDIKKIKKD
jgi:uncharacterized protein YneF (UPF0154 family)